MAALFISTISNDCCRAGDMGLQQAKRDLVSENGLGIKMARSSCHFVHKQALKPQHHFPNMRAFVHFYMSFCYIFKIKYLMNNRFTDFTVSEFFPELIA